MVCNSLFRLPKFLSNSDRQRYQTLPWSIDIGWQFEHALAPVSTMKQAPVSTMQKQARAHVRTANQANSPRRLVVAKSRAASFADLTRTLVYPRMNAQTALKMRSRPLVVSASPTANAVQAIQAPMAGRVQHRNLCRSNHRSTW